MTDSSYEQRYKRTVTDFFDGRTSYDNSSTIGRALPLLERVELRPRQRVLDVATGTGIIAIAAAQKVGSGGYVTGVDFSAGMLRQAEQKSEQIQLENIEWIKADADYLDFPAARFDAVFCSSALVYLKDIASTLASWHRWLKIDGMAAFSGWSDTSYPAPWIIQACACHGISLSNINAPTGTKKKCTDLLQAAGFHDVVVAERQLGCYKSVEQLSGWTGDWFHPKKSPLADVSAELRHSIVSEYHNLIASKETDKGVWCESLAYYASGRKVRQTEGNQ